MNLISKKNLLEALNIASMAITDKDIIANSDCFFLSEKSIKTHKDTLACYIPFKLDINAIVKASYFYNIINSFPYEELILEVDENNLIISSISKKLHFKLLIQKQDKEFDIGLDYENVSFKELPKNFLDQLLVAASSASKDIQQRGLICINVKDKNMLSGSTFSVCKIDLSFPLPEMQIPINVIETLRKFKPTHYVLNNTGWIHFLHDYNFGREGCLSCLSFRHGIEPLSDEKCSTIISLVENINKDSIDISKLISNEFIDILDSIAICSHNQADELNPYYNVLITYDGKSNIECKSMSNKIGSSFYSLEMDLGTEEFKFYINPILLQNFKTKYEELKIFLCDNRIIFVGSDFKYSICLLDSYIENK